MFTVTCAKLLIMVLESLAVITHLYLSYCLQSRFQRLSILPETSLQIDGIPRWPKLRFHEFLGRSAEGCALSMIVVDHGELVYPQYRAQALYISCLFILDKVPLE